MARALIVTIVLLVLTWIHRPVGAGLVWDGLNALGFVALAAIVVLHLDDLGPLAAASSRRFAHATHAWIAQAALVLVFAHVGGLLAFDPIVFEYVEPGAPSYMWAGVGATLVLVVAIWSAHPVRRHSLFATRARFRRVHRLVGAIGIALTVWHVAGSGFYLGHGLVTAALVGIALCAVVAPRVLRAGLDRITPELGRWAAVSIALSLAAVHTGLRNL